MKQHQDNNLLTLTTRLHHLSRRPLALAGLILATTSLGLSSLLALPVQATGSTTLYLSPASSTTNVGSTLSVTVRENSGSTDVNAVEADFSYPSNLLQYASTDFSSSAFEIAASSTGGSGTVSIARGTVNLTLSGDQVIGIVNFNVLAAGSATLSFLNSSAVAATSNSANTIGTMTGGSYTLQTPPVTPPARNPPSTTPPKTTTTTKSTTTTTTTKPATTTTTTPATTTTTASPTTTTTPATAVTYLVAVKVLNAAGKPEAGVQVTLANLTVKSDATGIASFTAVPAGYHQLTIKQGATSQKESIEVSSAKSPSTVQQFNYKLAAATTVPTVVWPVIVVLIILALAGGTIFFRKNRLTPLTTNQATVTVSQEGNLPTPNPLPIANAGQIIQPTTLPSANLANVGVKPLVSSDNLVVQTPPADNPTPVSEESVHPAPPVVEAIEPPTDINQNQL